jgi:hypothetical protein
MRVATIYVLHVKMCVRVVAVVVVVCMCCVCCVCMHVYACVVCVCMCMHVYACVCACMLMCVCVCALGYGSIRCKTPSLFCVALTVVQDRLTEQMEHVRGQKEESQAMLDHMTSTVTRLDHTLAVDGVPFLAQVQELTAVAHASVQKGQAVLREPVPINELQYPVVPVGDQQHGRVATALLHALAELKLDLALVDIPHGPMAAMCIDPTLQDLEVTGTLTLSAGHAHRYRTVTVRTGGVLTVAPWDSTSKSGGWLQLDVVLALKVEPGGAIDTSGKGYCGGHSTNANDGLSQQGESPVGMGVLSTLNNGSGGGGGCSKGKFGSVGGGGGAYGTPGVNAEPNRLKKLIHPGGVGGAMVGDPTYVCVVHGARRLIRSSSVVALDLLNTSRCMHYHFVRVLSSVDSAAPEPGILHYFVVVVEMHFFSSSSHF